MIHTRKSHGNHLQVITVLQYLFFKGQIGKSENIRILRPFYQRFRIRNAGIIIYDFHLSFQFFLCQRKKLLLFYAERFNNHKFHLFYPPVFME